MTNIPPEFNDWWDKDELTTDNPYRKDSPVYWAWEGWQEVARNSLNAKRIEELEANLAEDKALLDRIGNELDDVQYSGEYTEGIKALKTKLAAAQAKVDTLMREYELID